LFEHLDYPAETSPFLAECLRCLRKGGVIRLVVPDAGMYLRLYTEPGWNGLAAARPLIREKTNNYRDEWCTYRTKMELINSVFRQGQEHKYAYDAETLILVLKDAGFSQVTLQAFSVSLSDLAPLDSPERKTESLYVEAIK
jgi:predicted SAM-dependent methyltransferase